MLMKSRLQEPRAVRPAPEGAGPVDGGLGRRPDGWAYLDPSVSQRMLSTLDAFILRVAHAASQGVSRRDFLPRTGEIVFGLSLLASDVLLVPGTANADFVCTGCNCQDSGCQLSGACGSSPLCTNSHCNSEFECALSSNPSERRRVNQATGQWAGFDCGASNAVNCWTECCAPGNRHRCCDCCTGSNTLPNCTSGSCGGVTKHACICRGTQCTNCCTSSGNPC
jgi:hypothetical protein